ncbi:MAG: hypothetical protein R6U98_09215 [Pirellulaceae bacterium]
MQTVSVADDVLRRESDQREDDLRRTAFHPEKSNRLKYTVEALRMPQEAHRWQDGPTDEEKGMRKGVKYWEFSRCLPVATANGVRAGLPRRPVDPFGLGVRKNSKSLPSILLRRSFRRY